MKHALICICKFSVFRYNGFRYHFTTDLTINFACESRDEFRACTIENWTVVGRGYFLRWPATVTAKTKYLTAKPKTSRQKQNTSRQNQKPHGKNKIPHGKTENLTAKPKTSRQNRKPHGLTENLTAKPKTSRQNQILQSTKPNTSKLFCFCCEVSGLPWGFWFCREVFCFCREVFWFCREVFCFCREVFGFVVTVLGHHKRFARQPTQRKCSLCPQGSKGVECQSFLRLVLWTSSILVNESRCVFKLVLNVISL